jgi:hypothetical protein
MGVQRLFGFVDIDEGGEPVFWTVASTEDEAWKRFEVWMGYRGVREDWWLVEKTLIENELRRKKCLSE